MCNSFKKGQKVKFNPTRDGWEDDYSLDGVWVGDIGVVTCAGFDDEVFANFTREDGTVCEEFCAFPEDLEAVSD